MCQHGLCLHSIQWSLALAWIARTFLLHVFRVHLLRDWCLKHLDSNMAHCWRCGPCCYRPFNTRILTSMGHSRLLQPITLVPYGIPVPVFLLGLFTSGNIITSFDLSKQDRIFHWIRLSILTTWTWEEVMVSMGHSEHECLKRKFDTRWKWGRLTSVIGPVVDLCGSLEDVSQRIGWSIFTRQYNGRSPLITWKILLTLCGNGSWVRQVHVNTV